MGTLARSPRAKLMWFVDEVTQCARDVATKWRLDDVKITTPSQASDVFRDVRCVRVSLYTIIYIVTAVADHTCICDGDFQEFSLTKIMFFAIFFFSQRIYFSRGDKGSHFQLLCNNISTLLWNADSSFTMLVKLSNSSLSC